MLQLPVYMDYHATTPCDPRVLEAMLPYFSRQFGNAASKGHLFGWQAAEAVQIAREQIAGLIHADPSEIIFTSGATESINLALKGVYELMAVKGKHIITVSTEHRAVLDTCYHLEKQGAEITYLPVGPDGLIDLEILKSAIRPDTILISVMWANNETGVIQPLQTIAEIAKQHKTLFFTDATQALGKIPINVTEDGIDLLAGSAHKLYGPKGVGILYVRRKNPRVRLSAQLDGGGQERGMRSGTLNVPGIVGFGKAAVLAAEEMIRDMETIGRLRDKLEKSLLLIEGACLNGHSGLRLPTVTNISFQDSAGKRLLEALLKDIAISSGSACSSASPEPSHVLKAMGLDDSLAYHAIRFSLGKYNKEEEIDFVIEKVGRTLKETTCLQD
ncbi:MAG: aminotransferase class V-fold PLP-dependent enzyme [Bacteroidota bacterium]|nr:aminotransferase class V-fold PLP-dependent enzyme [Bacteroidota bacterium]